MSATPTQQRHLAGLVATRTAMAKPAPPPPLPEAFRPWQAIFEEMPRQHLDVLAPLMANLSELIDDAAPAAVQPLGAIDALDGLAMRGEIERLLTSEWLWRDLDETEFLRRLAEGELLYHHLARKAVAEKRGLGLIIDVGPNMLGRPRLVALAALLVLARRARREGMPLFWQSQGLGAWQEGLSRENLNRFLTHVSATPLEEAQVLSLMAAPPPEALGLDMRWYVLAPARLMLPEDAPAIQILVAEKPEIDDDGRFGVTVEVTVLESAGRSHRRSLALPAEEAAASLLRDPFRRPFTALTMPAPLQAADAGFAQRHAAFSGNGRLLMLAQPDGVIMVDRSEGFLAWFVPIHPHERLVGIRLADGFTFALLKVYADFCHIDITQFLSTGGSRTILKRRLAKDDPLAHGRYDRRVLPGLGKPGKKQAFFVHNPAGQAIEIGEAGTKPYDILSRGRIIRATQGHLLVQRSHGHISICVGETGHSIAKFDAGLPPDRTLAAEDVLYNPESKLVALRKAEGRWSFYSYAQAPCAELPPAAVLAAGDRAILPHLDLSPDAQGRLPALDYINREGQLCTLCDGLVRLSHRLGSHELSCDSIIMANDGSSACLELGADDFVERVLFTDRSSNSHLLTVSDLRKRMKWLRT